MKTSKFKIGDIIICKPGGIEIWVTSGKEYEVLGIEMSDPEPANTCYRNCGHPMHDSKPSKYFVIINDTEKQGKASILEDCFELKP